MMIEFIIKGVVGTPIAFVWILFVIKQIIKNSDERIKEKIINDDIRRKNDYERRWLRDKCLNIDPPIDPLIDSAPPDDIPEWILIGIIVIGWICFIVPTSWFGITITIIMGSIVLFLIVYGLYAIVCECRSIIRVIIERMK